ncbi:hypothetical protein ACIRD9_17710 [Streptomyces violaceus]|uniref:hypothetical protein n=1 Tax=Streptomyces violaceus TaxID=1936 RepID=UPI0037FDD34A
MSASGSGLRRTLGVGDAVVIGLGSMIGAGIFAALAPAALDSPSPSASASAASAARVVAGVGLAVCVVLAFSLPAVSVVVGAGVLVAGAVVHGVRRWAGAGAGRP